jgi:dihydrofolate synthase/folylpolyglutamate synthase
MDFNDIDSAINRFERVSIQLGLERIQHLLTALNNPHLAVPVIHVAGTNGKGSVCAYLSSVLTAAGYHVGRYTSPHLTSWCERICINETPIAPEVLVRLLLTIQAAIRPDLPSPTQFEVITAAAWLHFAEQQVDIAVVEVGLGGRLDATNVCDRPLVTIITSLSLDHEHYLGTDLSSIAFEKAGILKSSCSAVIAPLPSEAEPVIKHRLRELGCPFVFPKPAIDLGDGWAEYGGMGNGIHSLPPLKYPLRLPGAHQLINSALAMATLNILRQQGWVIEDEAIVEGMSQTHWPARLQWTTWETHPLLIDGAHNPSGAAALRHYVDNSAQITKPIRWIIGLLATKDHAGIFQNLLRPGDRLYLVPVPDHLSADLESLVVLAQETCPNLAECRICDDVIPALQTAYQASDSKNTHPTTQPTIVLCGSLYLIGHFLKHSLIEE